MCNVAVEWTSSINGVVDSSACYKHEPGVKDCLGYVPRPPMSRPLKQERGRDIGEMLCSQQLSTEQLAEARRAYRFDVSLVLTLLSILILLLLSCMHGAEWHFLEKCYRIQ